MLMFLSALFIAKAIYNWIHALILRAVLYLKLLIICKRRGFKMKTPRFFFSSFFLMSKKPDILIKTGDTNYLIRIITCRARKRAYHFVNHEWFVRVFRLYMLLPFMNAEEMAPFKHAFRLPPLDEKYLSQGAENEDAKPQVVLLFNPSPLEITFTSCSNRREIGTNGSSFDGWLIYNGKAFAELLKRPEGEG